MNRRGRKVRDLEEGSLSLTEDIEIKGLNQLPHLIASGEIAPQKQFRGKRSPGKLVSAEFFYDEDEDLSGPVWAWDE